MCVTEETANYKIYKFHVFGDQRGKLISLESKKNIPFDIKRIFYIYDTSPEQERGKHAHKEVEQVVVAINGSCQFILDNGVTRKTVQLNSPDVGLYIGKKIWNEMSHFSHDCKLMVLASDYYNENEYIRDYSLFKKLVND